MVSAACDRAESDPLALKACLEVWTGEALASAHESDRRYAEQAQISEIDGVPFAVKANFSVARHPHHAGIAGWVGRRATEGAAIITQLRQAGAIPMALTNMDEGALGAETNNPRFGRTRNPWNAALSVGGSSGGSAAAVAAGLCPFALGTDTLGSVRIPAAYCGVVGFKPSFGVLSMLGVIPLAQRFDHSGVIAQTAPDIELIWKVLTPTAQCTVPKKPIIAIGRWSPSEDDDPEFIEAYAAATELLSEIATLKEVDISSFTGEEVRKAAFLLVAREACESFPDALLPDARGYSDAFRGMLQWAHDKPLSDILKAQDQLDGAATRLNMALDSVDALVMPTVTHAPFEATKSAPKTQADFTAIVNAAGVPVLTLPASTFGTPPFAIQILASRGDDDAVLSLASKFEAARGAVLSPATESV